MRAEDGRFIKARLEMEKLEAFNPRSRLPREDMEDDSICLRSMKHDATKMGKIYSWGREDLLFLSSLASWRWLEEAGCR